jgi:hypothetical protein
MSFSQKGPRSVCILSANGTISNVTLRQPDPSGSTFTYEVWTVECYFLYLIILLVMFRLGLRSPLWENSVDLVLELFILYRHIKQ